MSTAALKVIVYVAAASVFLQTAEGIPATTPVNSDYEDMLLRQIQDLKSLTCTPVLQKVMLADVLEPHDKLADMKFHPRTVVVKRCLDQTSFCGDHKFGLVRGRCSPNPQGVKARRFIVVYYEEGEKYREVWVQEHTSCMCT